jgi:drug/metabolite transporter (DMT)-like permease
VSPASTRRAYLALGFGILCIGLSAIFVKLAGVPGIVSGFYRVLIAALILVPLWLVRGAQAPARRVVALIVLGGVFFGLDLALWNTALLMTSAAQATLLANNAPLWVGLGALILFKEKLTRIYWLGLLLALAGMMLVARPAAGPGFSLDAGSLMAIAASMLYAAYLLTTQRVRSTTTTVTFMTLSVVSSSVLLFGLGVATHAPFTGHPLSSWLALLGLGLISQVGGWLSINYALGHLPATQVSVSLLGQVLVTTLIAIPLFGEIPLPIQIVGGALVLAGIYLVQRSRQL